jgi:hypothetical protein
MADFKDKRALRNAGDSNAQKGHTESPVLLKLNEKHEGWYEGDINFKRVQLVQATGKFQYRDTRFVARVKAESGLDCYNRIVDHLRTRVDERSQFPSPKGKNYSFRFLGRAK